MGGHGLEYEHGFRMMSNTNDGQAVRETMMLQHWKRWNIVIALKSGEGSLKLNV